MGILSKIFGHDPEETYGSGYELGLSLQEEAASLDYKAFSHLHVALNEEYGYKDGCDACYAFESGTYDGLTGNEPRVPEVEERPWWKKIW